LLLLQFLGKRDGALKAFDTLRRFTVLAVHAREYYLAATTLLSVKAAQHKTFHRLTNVGASLSPFQQFKSKDVAANPPTRAHSKCVQRLQGSLVATAVGQRQRILKGRRHVCSYGDLIMNNFVLRFAA
jgi:hypothetical protein